MTPSAREENIVLPAFVDARPLSISLFMPAEPAAAPVAAVQILPATGVPRRFYRRFALYLASRHRCAVASLDYRGVGGSAPEPGGLAGFDCTIADHWAKRDQPAVTRLLAERFPNLPITSIGHSVGGHITPLNPLRENVARCLFIAVNSAYHGCHPPLSRLKTLLFPAMTEAGVAVKGYFPARAIRLCDDIPAGVARDWARWTTRKDYCCSEPAIRKEYASFSTPWHSVAFSDDGFSRGALAFAEWNRLLPGNGPEALSFLDPEEVGVPKPVGHLGFFWEREGKHHKLWDAVVPWIHDGKRPTFPKATTVRRSKL